MGTMNISLPDTLRDFVDGQVASAGYGTSSEYVRELIRRDQERLRLRAILLDGAQSAPTGVAATRTMTVALPPTQLCTGANSIFSTGGKTSARRRRGRC